MSSGLFAIDASALPLAMFEVLLVAERRSSDGSSWHPVRARCRERALVPAVGCEHERSGIVLEHPAGEVAARPGRERRRPDRGTCGEWRAQQRLEHRREAQVASERAPDITAIAG